MSLLEDTLARIEPPDEASAAAVERQLAAKLEDGGQPLGELRHLLTKYAAITRTAAPETPDKCTVICCADHGVAAMKVSAYPVSTTVQMTANYLISRGGVANALANFSGAELLVVDLGIAAPTEDIPGLIQRKIALGTQNCAVGPAMSREQAVQAVETGIELANKCAAAGCRCFLPGEMGIANTTSSACVVASFCGLTPEQATGRGTNISDDRLRVKIDVVRQALTVNRPDPADGLDVLAKVGGFEIGCIAGIILGAAANHGFVVLDGFNTGAAALIAQALSPLIPHYLMGSHLAAEPAHGVILDKLGLRPYMDLRFRLGEATGSSIAVNLLDAALLLLQSLNDDEQQEAGADFYHRVMPPRTTPLTNKTFGLYLKSVPELSKTAMEACQLRIDNLTKPIYSLGYLEEIAVELAGILDDERPPLEVERSLLVFTDAELEPAQRRLTAAFAKHADAEVTIARLRRDRPLTEAFDFGRSMAEHLSFTTSLLGVSLAGPGTAAERAASLRQRLLKEDGSLRCPAEDFLTNAPEELQTPAAAMLGTLIAAAHNDTMVILDDEATEIIARCAEALCPDVKPYILHVQPALLRLGLTAGGGAVACLGMRIVDAALHMLNDMKTFAEAGVSVANDGPGAGRQRE